MIVVDTNVIAYLLLPSPYTSKVEQLYKTDFDWCVPYLWRSEFRNVLAGYFRKEMLSEKQFNLIFEEAKKIVRGKEYEIETEIIVDLIKESSCSAYDCEYIALAKELGAKFFTYDKKIIREFSDIAMKPS